MTTATATANSATTAEKIFPHLLAEVHNKHNRRQDTTAHYIARGWFPTWAEENRNNPDRGLEAYSTPKKWEAYKAGEITREKAIELATARAYREIAKDRQKDIDKLERIAIAPELQFASINIEWVRSSTWGYNPHATVSADNMTTEARASGCGYDKASAALGSALNANPAILKILYTTAENALQRGERFNGYNNGNVTWRDVLGYGSGYDVLPYFEGGVGVSCHERIINGCGYNFRMTATGKHFDSYIITKGEKNA